MRPAPTKWTDRIMTDGLLKKCLNNGIRMTSQRQIIVGVIENSEDHPDVDQLYRRAVEEDTTISIATVYRTVKLLEEAGVIDRLEFGDGRARYEESGEHHEHLVDVCLLYTSPSPRDRTRSRMPSSA